MSMLDWFWDVPGLLGGASDTIAPTCVLTSPALVGASFVVTATFSEAVTGLAADDITVTNGAASNLATVDYIIYTVDVAPVATGAVTVQVPASVCIDAGGNSNTASNVLSVLAILDGRWLNPRVGVYQDAAKTTPAGDGNPVGGWADQINTDDATQSDAARPVLDSDAFGTGNPGVVFDGAADYLAWNAIAALITGADTPYSLCFALKLDSTANAQYVLGAGSTLSNNPIIVQYTAATDTILRRSDTGSGDQAQVTIPEMDTATHVITVIFTGTTISYRLDGATELNASAMNTGTLTLNRFTLGALARAAVSNFAACRLGDVVFVPRAFSASEIVNLETFIAGRVGVTLSEQGIWTWFNNPRGLDLPLYTAWGGIDWSGNAIVACYEKATGRTTPVTLRASFGADDHNNPSFLVRISDSRLIVFYCKHSDPAHYYMRVSTNPNDPTAWEAEVDLFAQLGGTSLSYAMPLQLDGEANDPIYLFYRNMRDLYVAKSTDDGANWTPALWVDNGTPRPYMHVIKTSPTRFDFVLSTGNPGDVDTPACHLYHGYYTGGKYYQSDGTLAGGDGTPPFACTDFTLVYDGTSVSGWNYDIAIDSGGQPVIAFVTLNTVLSDHRYQHARWSGSAWAVNQIALGGAPMAGGAAERYYSGGIGFDHANPNHVYLSREIDGIHQICKEVTADNGVTWAETQLTTGVDDSFRPYVLGDKLIYFYGAYVDYSHFSTRVFMLDL